MIGGKHLNHVAHLLENNHMLTLDEITTVFAEQIKKATPHTAEQIDAMIESRRERYESTPDVFESIKDHLKTKVGVKQLYYISRGPGNVQVLSCWEDKLDTLIPILEEFTCYQMSAGAQFLPEFIHNELKKARDEAKEKTN